MARRTKDELKAELAEAMATIANQVQVIKTKDKAIDDLQNSADLLRDPDFCIEQLERCGFKYFTDAKLEDVREKDGRRHRTFRNAARYAIILAKR